MASTACRSRLVPFDIPPADRFVTLFNSPPGEIKGSSEESPVLKALERTLASVHESIVLLAPSAASAAGVSHNVVVDGRRHRQLIQDLQRFRGRIYLKDGALQPHQLSPSGLHRTPEDERGWHLLSINAHGQVRACALYLEHHNTVSFDDLRVRHSALASDAEWRPKLTIAIASELARARHEGLKYVELAGWAVAEESRGTSGPLALALAVYGFSRRRGGGALGLTTATFRHCSAIILKRLGGARFDVDGFELPPYFDPTYNCMMEMLRFDSRRPNPKYVGLIDAVTEKLSSVLVIARPVMAKARSADAVVNVDLDSIGRFSPAEAGRVALAS